MTDKELFAYAAGIIDADGYIGLIPSSRKNTSLSPKIKLASTTPIIIEFLQKNFGGHVDKPRFGNNPNQKEATMWTLSNKINVGPLLESIEPYLLIKKERANVVIDYIKTCSYAEMRSDKTRDAAIKKRLYFYNKMRALNKRGISTSND